MNALLRRMDPAAFTGLATAALALLLLGVCAAAYTLDERLLYGVSVWSKPMKFNLSFAIHLLTLVWLWHLVAPAARARWPARLLWPVAAASTLIELLYIALQAARGRASHFNFETRWETVFYFAVMGGGALAMVLLTLAMGLLVWRHPRAGITPGYRLGAILGLTLGALATLATAGVMSAGVIDGPGHWVRGIKSDAAGLPLLGWSTTGGDLRVPHFVATHLTQALPLLGWLLDRARLKTATAWVASAATIGLGMVAATFVQAARGLPVLGA